MRKVLVIMSLIFTFANSITLKSLETDNIKKPILVIISQDYCKFCEKQKKTMKNDKELIKMIHSNFQFIELNRSRVLIPNKLSSRGSPATFILDENGNVIDKNVGYMKADYFKYKLKEALRKINIK